MSGIEESGGKPKLPRQITKEELEECLKNSFRRDSLNEKLEIELRNERTIKDINTPPNSLMRGIYKKSFAYHTLSERIPVILTQIIDNLCKDKEEIIDGFSADEEKCIVKGHIKDLVGRLSELKYRLQTDKPILQLNDNIPDCSMWNLFVSYLPENENTYFKTCWLYAECYVYRSINSYFSNMKLMKDFDYFKKQKDLALMSGLGALAAIAKYSNTNSKLDPKELEQKFNTMVRLDLWGNRNDLSISCGQPIEQDNNPVDSVNDYDEFLLINDCDKLWKFFSTPFSGVRVVDFVLDNVGMEFVSDLLFINFLLKQNLVTQVRIHPKAIPWFISDVTKHDFEWTLKTLSAQSNDLCSFAAEIKDFIQKKKIILVDEDYFWTSPFEYHQMQKLSPLLYDTLQEADLVIFKGDLNYRKLIGDFSWDFTTKFDDCLREFNPTNLVTFRTVKADLICGLKEGVAQKMDQTVPDWMTTGRYGVIQYHECTDEDALEKRRSRQSKS